METCVILSMNEYCLTISGGIYKAVGVFGGTAKFNAGSFVGFEEDEYNALLGLPDKTIQALAYMFETNSMLYYYAGSTEGATTQMNSFLADGVAFDTEINTKDVSQIFGEPIGTTYISRLPANTTIVPTYTVSFNNMGIAEDPEPVIIKQGAKLTYPPVPAAAGYVFIGWYLDEDYQTPFDAETSIEKDYVLYAKFSDYQADSAALKSAIQALGTASNDLNAALATKADKATVDTKVAGLTAAIANAEALAKAYADEKDAVLKTELMEQISLTKDSLLAIIAAGDKAVEDELRAEIDELQQELTQAKGESYTAPIAVALVSMVANVVMLLGVVKPKSLKRRRK